MTGNFYQYIMRKRFSGCKQWNWRFNWAVGGSSFPVSNLTSNELKVKCSTVLKMLVFVQMEILSNYNICINHEGIHSIFFSNAYLVILFYNVEKILWFLQAWYPVLGIKTRVYNSKSMQLPCVVGWHMQSTVDVLICETHRQRSRLLLEFT